MKKLKKESEYDLSILPDLLGYNIRITQINTTRRFIKSVAGTHKITPTQLTFLILTDANPAMSQVTLGNLLGMDRASTMLVIDKLENKHWLARHKSKVDRRKHELHITPKGKTVLKHFISNLNKHEKRIAKNLTAKEKKQLLTLLEKVRG